MFAEGEKSDSLPLQSCQGSVCFALQSPPRAVGRPEEKLAEPWDNGIVTSVTKGSMSGEWEKGRGL